MVAATSNRGAASNAPVPGNLASIYNEADPCTCFPVPNESLVHNRDHVTVAIEDLDAELADRIRKAPADYLLLFETAGSEVLASLRSKVAGETWEMEEPVTGDVQIFLSSKENCVSMKSIGITCGAIVPRSCDHVPQPGEEPCPWTPRLQSLTRASMWIYRLSNCRKIPRMFQPLSDRPESLKPLLTFCSSGITVARGYMALFHISFSIFFKDAIDPYIQPPSSGAPCIQLCETDDPTWNCFVRTFESDEV
ncbi:hypothetical protein ZWY2020_040901 [Hordeum vulgare]|nr:hypothetical protein ZWY2020_040901 [Hordeum vulgare]